VLEDVHKAQTEISRKEKDSQINPEEKRMMHKKAIAAFALLTFCCSTGASKDARDVVKDVARAMGAASVKSLQYSGSGIYSQFGQSYLPNGPYPRFYAKYSRVLDYEKELSREELVRTQFENPPRGGGGQPLYREAHGVTFASESSAWGGGAVALTPHGWVKAAMAANPTMKSMTIKGKPVTVVSFTLRDKYKINGYVDSQNLLEKVETWMPNPILGDTLIETTYLDYKDFGGAKFPTKIAQKLGGLPVLDLTVSDVQLNAPVSIEVPRAAQSAAPPAHVESQKIAEGVWYLAGTPDPNSMAVEFKDYVVLIESSVTEARALANMEEVKRLVPNKPIRYHLNSHHHSDHAAGLRAFVAEGSIIITHEMNKPFYEQVVLKSPHALEPDKLSRNPKPAKFIWVKDKYVLSDGDRSLEIYAVPGAGHTANLLMSFLPKEKILFITDIFNQFGEARPNDPPPGIVSPYYAALGENLKRLNLDVQQLAPSHGKGAVSVELLRKALEGTVQAPTVTPPSGN
jgi:glyoxylase-like metal-dependent hydrolase (beta-lactamase superfamily II)